jgi:hypothetical protein
VIHLAFLVLVAVLWYYAGPPLLVPAALIGFFVLLCWLFERYPRAMIVVVGFLSGL